MGRLPAASDFPNQAKVAVVPPPGGDSPSNVLVLCHGFGDTHASFSQLGKQMNLPETACISVQGPSPLLDLGGFHFGDDVLFDSSNGGLEADAGFKQSNKLLNDIVHNGLLQKCGYKLRDIVFLGFGQGGMAALSFAAQQSSEELGGVISVGAGLPSDVTTQNQKCKTPVLVCAGSNASSVTAASEEKLRNVFTHVEVKRYRRSGDGMPHNRDEMMPIMQFFSRRLKSTKGVPARSVEVG